MSKKKNKIVYEVITTNSWLFSEYANVCEFLEHVMKGYSECSVHQVEVDADTFFSGDAFLKDTGLKCLEEVRDEK